MRAAVTLGARAVIHALLTAGRPVSAGELAETAGLSLTSLSSTASLARKALVGLDVRIIQSGPRAALAYRIEGLDLDQARAIAGEPVRPLAYMGFTGLRARVLRTIVETGGRPITLDSLTRDFYGRAHQADRLRIAAAISHLRLILAERGSAETILSIGGQSGGVYLWGPVLADLGDEPDGAESVITLPSVGGSYRYAAGRLQAPRFEWEVA